MWDINLVNEVNVVLRGCSIFLGNGFDLLLGFFEHTEKAVLGGCPAMRVDILGEPWWDLDAIDDGHWFCVIPIDAIGSCDIGGDEVLDEEAFLGGVGIVMASHHIHDTDGGKTCNSAHAVECNVVGRFHPFGG